jgi:hypothetical protein
MFHQYTLHALKELVQAAGLEHPGKLRAHHIVRRVENNEVRLLSDLVTQMPSGALLQDDLNGLHGVFQRYWGSARADTFRMRV